MKEIEFLLLEEKEIDVGKREKVILCLNIFIIKDQYIKYYEKFNMMNYFRIFYVF